MSQIYAVVPVGSGVRQSFCWYYATTGTASYLVVAAQPRVRGSQRTGPHVRSSSPVQEPCDVERGGLLRRQGWRNLLATCKLVSAGWEIYTIAGMQQRIMPGISTSVRVAGLLIRGLSARVGPPYAKRPFVCEQVAACTAAPPSICGCR